MKSLWNDSETPLDVRHDGQVAYVLQPGLNLDVPDVLAHAALAQCRECVRRVPTSQSPEAVQVFDAHAHAEPAHSSHLEGRRY